MPSPAARAAVIAALVVAAAAIGAGMAVGQEAPPSDSTTTMRVILDSDGDATWSVKLRFPLGSATETRAFERLAAEFESSEAGVLPTTPFREAASLAAAETGRPMSIENVSRSSVQQNDTGQLVLSFQWTNFSRMDGDRIELGDVFTTGSGTWLPALADGQELIVEFPAGYAPQSSSHRLRNGTIHVRGPTRFAPGEPSVTLARTALPTTSTETPPSRSGGIPPAAGAAVLVVLVGTLVYLVRYRSGSPGEAGVGEAVGGDDGGSGGEEPLLSDEERVLRLLRENGGRMKQVDIVEETDWSNAKVSQLLSGMASDGRVEKLRIGRENLISVPDRPPDDR